MSDISDLENRISAAMDRISRGLEALEGATSTENFDVSEAEKLKQSLADERLAGAQLEERVKSLSEKQETLEANLANAKAKTEAAKAALGKMTSERDAARADYEAYAARATAEEKKATELTEGTNGVPVASDQETRAKPEVLAELARRLRRMRGMSKNLRENNNRLREAASKGITDPEVINVSMRVELENMKAWRETDLLETEAILAELRPMLNVQIRDAGDDIEPIGEA
ncbi:hypothetical protein ACMAZE_07955 [Pseudopelagicola sp. nBUS_20]|uniref:hypothetical protein n=1 Tax=Pseudopelagicola sp. nBUS_20 TaxID=3395317 RepID=UPI003EBED9A2